MLTANGKVTLVVSDHGAMHCDVYADRLAMIKQQLNRGGIGDGTWGSDQHLTALREVVATAQNVADSIINPDPNPYEGEPL